MIAPARPAATVCLLRDGDSGVEVLMVRRGSTARFMGGAWVFPGGVVEEADGPVEGRETSATTWVRAGLRELAEEVRIWATRPPLEDPPEGRPRGEAVYGFLEGSGADFDLEAPVLFANWITPSMVPVRFDTRFYALEGHGGARPDPDPAELSAAEWVDAAAATRMGASGERLIALPTRRVLETLARYSDVRRFFEFASSLEEVAPTQARGRIRADGAVELVMPGELGYDELDDDSPAATDLSDSARARLAAGHVNRPDGRR